jgi:DHA2 family multidrug resistance protein
VPDASGLFNLMRNLGGAIGIALIDTVLYGRAPLLGERLVAQMKAGSAEAAGFVGIALDDFATLARGSMDIEALGELEERVEKAALTMAVNEAWLMLAAITLVALLALVTARRPAA